MIDRQKVDVNKFLEGNPIWPVSNSDIQFAETNDAIAEAVFGKFKQRLGVRNEFLDLFGLNK